VVCPNGEGLLNVADEVFFVLLREGEDEVHGDGLKGDGCEGFTHVFQLECFAPEGAEEFVVEGLNADANFAYASGFELAEGGDVDILRVELKSDTFADDEMCF